MSPLPPQANAVWRRYAYLLCILLFVLPPPRSFAQTTADPSRSAVRELDTVTVSGQKETSRDETGRDDVYLKDVSNVYAGKEELERYKINSVGDLFNGLNGVYSGDTRNSGALDANIRGLQGGGRVPVTIDGTEQATSVWMGPAGVANRNYIDPSLVSSVMVEKGPSMTPGLSSGIGGSVQLRTLVPEDIIRPGRTFGIELKASTATNSVRPHEGSFDYFGKDYRDIPGAFSPGNGGYVAFPMGVGTEIWPRSGSSGTDFNFNDKSFRVALATKQEKFDFLAAYSYRSRGNYYSGKSGAEGYETDSWLADLRSDVGNNSNALLQLPNSYIANYFRPGQEVANTSSELESTLLKGTLQLPYDQTLKLSYIHTDHTFGESIPWLVSYAIAHNEGDAIGQEQWPYSNVKQQTYNLGYAFKPQGNQWIDLDVGLWMTESDTSRHQNGDAVFGIRAGTSAGASSIIPRDTSWDAYVQCHVQHVSWANCAGVPDIPPEKLPDPDGRYTLYPRALQISSHDRWGVNLSNRFQLAPGLSLTVGGDFNHERLVAWDASNYERVGGAEYAHGGNYLGPRSGRREQYNLQFNFDWAATDWLQISGGYRYADYWATDDLVTRMRANRVPYWEEPAAAIGMTFTYREIMSDAEIAAYEQQLKLGWQENIDIFKEWFPDELAAFLQQYPTAESFMTANRINGVRYKNEAKTLVVPVPHASGSYEGFADANPFLNGTFNVNEQAATTLTASGNAPRYIVDGGQTVYGPAPTDPWKKPEKKRGHAWAPQLGATLFLTDSARVYARYSEFVRFPSLYEATQAAWGIGGNITNAVSRPEHAYNWEVGYVQDLTPYLPSLKHADVRLNYFDNRIRDYMDRDYFFNIVQFHEKKLSGIELQSRFDTGRYYINVGATYRLKQEMCDRDYASYLDPIRNRIPSCVDGGFPYTFARTALQPQYSINLEAGARLLANTLQIGGRMTYHSTAKNTSDSKDGGLGAVMGESATAYNRPYYWNPIWVFDFYANYAINDSLTMDFAINNLTNRYYVDPMARVSQPAPGRTLTVGMTARF